MRKRWIASLVSLSLASVHSVRAQETLWFTPNQPAVVNPASTSEGPSFSQRYGGLLSKPGSQTQSSAPSSEHNVAPSPATPRVTSSSNPGSLNSNLGVRQFDIPWSLTANVPASANLLSSPADKVTTPAPSSETGQSSKQRGAQVTALTPQVKPNYVRPTAKKNLPDPTSKDSSVAAAPLGLVDQIPWQTGPSRPVVARAEQPRQVAAIPTNSAPVLPPAVLSAEFPPVELVNAAPNLPMVARKGPARANIVPATAARSQPDLTQPLDQVAADQQLANSLIQSVPQDKLSPHLLAPPAEPTEPIVMPTAVPAQLTNAITSPHYALVDIQQSASDRQGATVVPAPPVTDRLTDKPETPSTIESVTNSAQPERPAQAAKQPAAAAAEGLLSTESMIGPLQGAEQLFSRLKIQEDLRDVADRIESGARGDAANIAWMPAPYTWISPAFYHYPLYFEQPNLERYGLGPRPVLQPLASSIHFFGSIPLVPYKTLTHHPRERVYTLGNMRPGNCVPVQRGVILGPSSVGEVAMFWEECSGY